MVKKPTYEELERRLEELGHVTHELAESEQQFRWIAENINEVFYIKDIRTGSYEYINPVFDMVFAVSREKLYEDSTYVFEVLAHPDDREWLNAARQRQDEQGEWFDDQYRILLPDGTMRWIWARSFPVSDEQGQVNRIVGIAEDITERKRVEHDIKERLKELRYLYSMSRIAERAGIGLNKICQEVVKVLPPSWQYPEITCSRITVNEDEFQTENYRDTVWKQCADIELHGAKAGVVEVGYLEERPAIDEGPFSKEERALINAIAEQLARIIERMKLEEELQKLDKLESIGTLAGGIAHDFNNLLTGIMGNISLAKRYVEPKSKAEDRLLEAEKVSLRVRDLTQQLLTFASGGAPIKKMASIAEIIKETADFALRGSNVKCEFSLPDDLWVVEVD